MKAVMRVVKIGQILKLKLQKLTDLKKGALKMSTPARRGRAGQSDLYLRPPLHHVTVILLPRNIKGSFLIFVYACIYILQITLHNHPLIAFLFIYSSSSSKSRHSSSSGSRDRERDRDRRDRGSHKSSHSDKKRPRESSRDSPKSNKKHRYAHDFNFLWVLELC